MDKTQPNQSSHGATAVSGDADKRTVILAINEHGSWHSIELTAASAGLLVAHLIRCLPSDINNEAVKPRVVRNDGTSGDLGQLSVNDLLQNVSALAGVHGLRSANLVSGLGSVVAKIESEVGMA